MSKYVSYDYGSYSGGTKYNYIKKKLPPDERIGVPDKKKFYSKIGYVPNKFYCQFPLHSKEAITSFDDNKTDQMFKPNKATSKHYTAFQKIKSKESSISKEFNNKKNAIETSNIFNFIYVGVILFILTLFIVYNIF